MTESIGQSGDGSEKPGLGKLDASENTIKGTRIICKHMVALYFTAFPEEADAYIAQVEENEREEERQLQNHYAEIKSYIKSLSKEELQEELFRTLIELEEISGSYW